MLGVAFGIGVLLALAGGTAEQDCVAPTKLVHKMLNDLEASVRLNELPNPSVLLAMNLARGTKGITQKCLLHRIKVEAVEKAQKDMSSGEVALYVLAILSSCEDPQHVHALWRTVNLLRILQQKMDEEMADLEATGVPKTTLYSVSLATLALCLTGTSGYQAASVVLAKQVLSHTNNLSVDTRAMAALALVCTYNRTDLHEVKELLQEALSTVTNGFLNKQEENGGMIGNIYSMGLALQALEATRNFYAPREWNCAQAFSVVYSHDYRQPMAIAQVLPALVGKSYLQAASVDCSFKDFWPLGPWFPACLSPTPGTTRVQTAHLITVHYSIVNKLQGTNFSYAIEVQVPAGSTLLKVLQEAEKDEPNTFSFKTKQTSWGPMVVSIHGLAANPDDRTYWEFLSGQDSLQEGVGTYQPWNGEHIMANFTTY